LSQLHGKYGKDVQFFVVYITEAHAMDGRAPMSGRGAPLVQEPLTWGERNQVAKRCVAAMEIEHLPTVIDELDDKVGQAYQGHPDRLFLVGKNGKIAYAGGRGPFGFRPEELDGAIKAELARIGQ